MTQPRSNPTRLAADVQRIVEVLVFAPIGLGAAIVTDGPDAVRRAKQELRNARFVGRIAVDRSIAELRRRIDEAAAPGVATDVIDVEPVEDSTIDASVASDVVPDAGSLALPDYDTLPAIDIIDKLEHLSPAERNAIRAYEEANRQRRTVLGKLAQLADA